MLKQYTNPLILMMISGFAPLFASSTDIPEDDIIYLVYEKNDTTKYEIHGINNTPSWWEWWYNKALIKYQESGEKTKCYYTDDKTDASSANKIFCAKLAEALANFKENNFESQPIERVLVHPWQKSNGIARITLEFPSRGHLKDDNAEKTLENLLEQGRLPSSFKPMLQALKEGRSQKADENNTELNQKENTVLISQERFRNSKTFTYKFPTEK